MESEDEEVMTNSQPQDMQEVKASFTKSEEHTKFYTNGVYGGKTPRGDIMVEFYTERNNLPTSQIYEVEESQRIGRLKSTQGAQGIIREREATAFMGPENAKSIGSWLLAKTMPEVSQQDIIEVLEEKFGSDFAQEDTE